MGDGFWLLKSLETLPFAALRTEPSPPAKARPSCVVRAERV